MSMDFKPRREAIRRTISDLRCPTVHKLAERAAKRMTAERMRNGAIPYNGGLFKATNPAGYPVIVEEHAADQIDWLSDRDYPTVASITQ